MVVEAGEVLKPFSISNKRLTPKATTPRQSLNEGTELKYVRVSSLPPSSAQ